jgi:tetratricopeptide (TPR) repeat protein
MRRPSSRGLTPSAVVAALLGLAPALAPGQEVAVESPAAVRLRVTTASEEAARHFWAGVGDARNIFFSRATTHFDRAIAIDSNLGLARVLRATLAPGLTQDERTAEVDRGLATLTSGATAEIVTALAFRESVAGHTKQAQALFQAATQILPGDPHLAFYAAQATANAEGPARGVEALRAVTEKFPDDAPSHNILAYLLWQTGDRDGAYTAVKRYVELAPDQPNAHDSHAELLQWDNRFSEALAHYGRAAELDSNYIEAYAGMAEVFQLTGRGRDARAMLQRAMARAPSTPARKTTPAPWRTASCWTACCGKAPNGSRSRRARHERRTAP